MEPLLKLDFIFDAYNRCGFNRFAVLRLSFFLGEPSQPCKLTRHEGQACDCALPLASLHTTQLCCRLPAAKADLIQALSKPGGFCADCI